MAKRPNQKQKQDRNAQRASAVTNYSDMEYRGDPRKLLPGPLSAQTEAQGRYISAMNTSIIIFGIGPAGTGKTYCAGAWAAEKLQSKRASRIIITRPNIEAGTPMGFLPGELEEKYEPYLQPFRSVMIERMGVGAYECAIKNEKICPEPLGFMRGKTFDDAVVILDEAQNCTPAEMKMFLTRIGKNCTVIIDGDPDQKDIPGPSGLTDAVRRLSALENVMVVEFDEDDIVRSGIVRDILRAYRN